MVRLTAIECFYQARVRTAPRCRRRLVHWKGLWPWIVAMQKKDLEIAAFDKTVRTYIVLEWWRRVSNLVYRLILHTIFTVLLLEMLLLLDMILRAIIMLPMILPTCQAVVRTQDSGVAKFREPWRFKVSTKGSGEPYRSLYATLLKPCEKQCLLRQDFSKV